MPRHHYMAAEYFETFANTIRAHGYVRCWYGWARPAQGKERLSHTATWCQFDHELREGNGDVVFLDDPDSLPRLAAIRDRAQLLRMPVIEAATKRKAA